MEFGTEDELSARLVQMSPLAVTVTTARDSRYIHVNHTFEQVTGWNRDEIIGRTPADIGLWVDPDERAKMVERLLSGQTVSGLTFTVRAKGGDVRSGLGWARLLHVGGEPACSRGPWTS